MAPPPSNTSKLLAPERPKPRRLSSMKTERADLFSGPATVAPETQMEHPGGGHDTAMAMEMAKYHLAEIKSGEQSPFNEETSSISTEITTPDQERGQLVTTDKYAFAFDIDGVLIRGGEAIPEAIEAMQALNGKNEYNIKV